MAKYKTNIKRKSQTGVDNISQSDLLWGNIPPINGEQPVITPVNDTTRDYLVDYSGDVVDNSDLKIVPLPLKKNKRDVVKTFNTLATGITGIANYFQNQKLKNQERLQVMKSQIPTYWENMESEGLNSLPIYTQTGGEVPGDDEIMQIIKMYSQIVGEQPDSIVNSLQSLSPEEQNQALQQMVQIIQQNSQSSQVMKYGGDKAQTGAARLVKKVPNGYLPIPDKPNYFQKTTILETRNKNSGKKATDKEWLKFLDSSEGKKWQEKNKYIDVVYVQPEQPAVQPIKSFDGQLIYGQDNKPAGMYRWKTRDGQINSFSNGQTDDGLVEWVDVDHFARPKGEIITIPASEFSNKIVRGTNVLQGITVLDKYRNVTPADNVFQEGGDIDTVYGLPSDMKDLADVEAEAGEVIQLQNNKFVKVADNAKTHEQGGEFIPGVKRVLEDTSDKRKDKASKLLKIEPNELKQVIGFKPNKPVSHAKAFELAKTELNKTVNVYQRAKKDANLRTTIDKTGLNTIRMNEKFQSELPTEDEIFDLLFLHQEGVKQQHAIQDDGSIKKYGGKKAQTGTINTYKGGTTKKGSVAPSGVSNAFSYPGGIDQFIKDWSPYLDLSQYNGDVMSIQKATYDYIVKNQPDTAALIWKEGLNAKGKDVRTKGNPSYNSDMANVINKYFDADGKRNDVKFSMDDLAILNDSYADGMLGVRAIAPKTITSTHTTPAEKTVKTTNTFNANVKMNPRFKRQPVSSFYEPTYWSDLAAPLTGLAESFRRDPELYNPVEYNQLRYKLLDPTAALNANQSDFNAALSMTDESVSSGASQANRASLLGNKYRVNNQVMSQYDNKNTQVENNKIGYNTPVRDKQSVANANTRSTFYRNVLLGREAQRQQYLTSLGQLARVDQLKRRQNRSGNMMMKLFPAFDQNLDYNGYQYYGYIDPAMLSYNEVVTIPGATTNSKKVVMVNG